LFVRQLDQGVAWDMSELEQGLKAAMMQDARRVLEWLVNEASGRQTIQGGRGTRMRWVETVLGPIRVRRAYCLENGRRCFPLDKQLGLVDSYTPGLLRLMIHAGAMDGSYEQAEQTLGMYAGLKIVGKQIQRMMHRLGPQIAAWCRERPAEPNRPVGTMYVCCDGTGVPMRRKETAGRKGRGPDGTAKTREIKLGCVFTQLSTDEDGHPLREPSSTSYCGTFEGAQHLGPLLRQEACRRGIGRAERTVFIGDGAAWVWKLAQINFPSAVQVLDFYHGCEHLQELARALWPEESVAGQHAQHWRHALEKGRLARVLKEARAAMPRSGPRRQAASEQLNYFTANAHRMRYASFRKQGLFIGSGVVEAGCKTVVAQRMKHSGMHWTLPGAEAVVATRCCILNAAYDDFWPSWKQKNAA
jgi:hypothetical protein